MDSNEKRMEVIGKSYTEIKNSIESLRTPTDKDNEQDDRLNKLESGLSSVKQQVSQYKTHIDTRFDDLKMFLEKYLK